MRLGGSQRLAKHQRGVCWLGCEGHLGLFGGGAVISMCMRGPQYARSMEWPADLKMEL